VGKPRFARRRPIEIDWSSNLGQSTSAPYVTDD
jgi:hypothetical protein